jgi:hypothetical protein
MDTLLELVNHPIFDNIVEYVLGRRDSKVTKQLLLIARHMGLAEGWGNFRDLNIRGGVDSIEGIYDIPTLPGYQYFETSVDQ